MADHVVSVNHINKSGQKGANVPPAIGNEA
jgi:hypothetical protein